MKVRVRAWLAMCMAISSLVLVAQTASPTQSTVSDDEYSVYSAVTMQTFWNSNRQVALFNLETLPLEHRAKHFEYMKGHFPSLEDSVVADLRQKPTAVLQLVFPFNAEYHVVQERKVSFGDGKGGKSDYPHSTGVLSFSRVGFNKTKTQALVKVRQYCGSLCSIEEWVFLSRPQGGEWRISAKLILGGA